MPELRPRELTHSQRRRPSTPRTLVVLLLVFVFCASALMASGAMDENIDASEASTRILTPAEAQRMAEEAAAPQAADIRAAPVALIGALLLVAGALLVSLAVPTRAERRRETIRTAPPPAPPAAPRRQMGAGIPDADPTPTTVFTPVRPPSRFAGTGSAVPAPEPVPDPSIPPSVERRYRAGAIMR